MNLPELSNSFNSVSLQAPTLGIWIAFGIVVVLLVCSGFVSASEIAFFSLTPDDKNAIDESEDERDEVVASLLDDSERLLATILICNNLVNVAIIVLLAYCFGGTVNFGNAAWLEFLVMTVLLTFLLLLFGEVIPKIYSAGHALAFCRFAAPKLQVLKTLFHPLSGLLLRSKAITKRLARREAETLTAADLEKAMELTKGEDIAEEEGMLKGIIRFGGETAKEIMTSRVDMVSLDVKDTFQEVLDCIVANNYSRIPVCQGTQDNVKGVLYIKDLLLHLGSGRKNFRWQSLVRPAYFVPETKPVDDLLRDFQSNKVHMAIVVDEFGGTSGLVTMEDILEEIVGEINDEYDEEEKTYHRLNQNTYVFEAKTLLSDLTKILGLDGEYFASVGGEAETLAGLLLEIKGEFPSEGERIEWGRCAFEVLEANPRRIVKVKVILHGE